MSSPNLRSIDISVVVPFRDEEQYLRRCVESLLAAEYPADRVEFVFVDNGSTDGGPAILAEYPRIQLLSEPRGMSYTARNAAIAVARGKAIAFTDADCVVDPRWLASIHSAIFDRGSLIALGPVCFPAPMSPLLDVLQTYRNDHIQYVVENEIWNHVYGYTNNMAIRADVFERLGPLEELPIPGDTEIVHRCLKRIAETKISYCPDMKIEHLELVSAWVLFRKLVYYGELASHFPQADYDPPHHRKLSGAESYTVVRNRFSLRQHLLFEFGLKASNACLWYGSRRGKLRRAWRRFRGGGGTSER